MSLNTTILKNALLLLAILLIGCAKEEVINKPTIAVKINGQFVSVSIKSARITRFYKVDHGTNDSAFSFLNSYFILGIGDQEMHVSLQQTGGPPTVYRGEFLKRSNNPIPDKFCYIMYGNGLRNLQNPKCIVQDYNEKDKRISVEFSCTLYENGNSIDITGDLSNVHYINYVDETF